MVKTVPSIMEAGREQGETKATLRERDSPGL